MYIKNIVKLNLIFVYVGLASSLSMRKVNETETVTTTVKPIINATRCSSSWKHFKGKCYKIYSNGIETIENKDFDDARQFCEGLQGSLAIITTKLEQDFLTTYLGEPGVRNRVWIGLEKDRTSSTTYEFTWVDGTIANYTNFALGEPNGDFFERCIHLDGSEAIAGQWNDVPCTEEMGFVCQITLAENHQEIDKLSEPGMCPAGFEKYLDICYKVENDPSDWFNAEEKCRAKHEGHLLSVLDLYEESFVNLLTVQNENDLWVGLSDTNKATEGLFQWSDGRPIYHTNWDRKEPTKNKGQSHRCVALLGSKKKWAVKNCEDKLGYICTVHIKEFHPKSHLPPIMGSCPTGWIDVGHRHCYLIVTDEKEPFQYAQQECKQYDYLNGSLAKFRSEHELLQLRPYLKRYTDHSFVMGIHEEHYGQFEFVDDDEPASYLPWHKGEPNNKEHEKCVELLAHLMQYNNFACDQTRDYICQIDKVIDPNVTEHPYASGLSGGGVAAIVITMMIVSMILSGLAVFFYRKKILDDKMKAGIFRFQNENREGTTTNHSTDHNSSHI